MRNVSNWSVAKIAVISNLRFDVMMKLMIAIRKHEYILQQLQIVPWRIAIFVSSKMILLSIQ